MSIEGVESSQDIMAPSLPSSQKAGFRKPAIPRRRSVAELRVQNERLMQQLERQNRQIEELIGMLKQRLS